MDSILRILKRQQIPLDIITAETLVEAVVNDLIQGTLSPQERREYAVEAFTKFFSRDRGAVMGPLLAAILPDGAHDSSCTGSPVAEEGVTCFLTWTLNDSQYPTELQTAGSYIERTEGNKISASLIDAEHPLHSIMPGCHQQESGCKDAPEDEPFKAQMWVPGSHTDLNRPQYGKPFSYGPISGYLRYQYGIVLRYRCLMVSPITVLKCDIWGEIYATGLAQYLATAADTAFVHFPFRLVCDMVCVYTGIGKYAKHWIGKQAGYETDVDWVDFALNGPPSQVHDQLLRTKAYIKLQAKGNCGVIPVPYQIQPSYRFISVYGQTAKLADEFDVQPHTNYQNPSTDPAVAALSTNMDPQPTWAAAELPKIDRCHLLPITVNFVWQYDFFRVASFQDNIIFGAFNNLNMMNSCGNDQIWTFIGVAHAEGLSMPSVTWVSGYAGGHLPYAADLLNQ